MSEQPAPDPAAERLAWMDSPGIRDEIQDVEWKARVLHFRVTPDPAAGKVELRLEIDPDSSQKDIRQTVELALADVDEAQRELGGRPRQRAQRSDARVERKTFFYWLRHRPPDGHLTHRESAKIWTKLTQEWSLSEDSHHIPSDGFDKYPQAFHAWREWSAYYFDLPLTPAEVEAEVAADEALGATVTIPRSVFLGYPEPTNGASLVESGRGVEDLEPAVVRRDVERLR